MAITVHKIKARAMSAASRVKALRESGSDVVNKGIKVAAATGTGMYLGDRDASRKTGVEPGALENPTLLAGAAFVGSAMTKGNVSRVLEGTAMGAAAVAGYKHMHDSATKKKSKTTTEGFEEPEGHR